MKQYPNEINEAIRLYKENNAAQSRESLRNYICSQCNQMDAILWLAKVSPDANEALRAAELAFYLDPDNEIAKRAVAGVSERFKDKPSWDPKLEIIRLTGMSQSQARAVNWPFRGLQKPIGVLMNDGTINIRDLAWATQNVTDEYIRQASRTILLSSLLVGDAGTLESARVIEGKSFAQSQEREATLRVGIGIGVMVGYAFVMVVFTILTNIIRIIPPLITGIFVLLIVFVPPLYFWIMNSLKDVSNYRVGQEGEKKTLDQLRASLPKPWVLIHNLSSPDRKWGDIDLVLIGPSGVWVLEVKTYSSEIQVRGNRWQYKSRFGWRNIKKHPGFQAKRYAVRLRDYLNQKGFNPGWVQPIVIWAGDEKLIKLDDPEISVWRVSEIQNHIEDLWQQRRLKEGQIQEIGNILGTIINKA